MSNEDLSDVTQGEMFTEEVMLCSVTFTDFSLEVILRGGHVKCYPNKIMDFSRFDHCWKRHMHYMIDPEAKSNGKENLSLQENEWTKSDPSIGTVVKVTSL